jgi:hypothetical protein
MTAWHTFSPRIVLAALIVVAIVVDWFRLGRGMESVGYINLAIVWLFAQQLGFLYADGYLARLTRRTLWATVAGSFGTLVVLTSWGPYPVSMVGLPDGDLQHDSPNDLSAGARRRTDSDRDAGS